MPIATNHFKSLHSFIPFFFFSSNLIFWIAQASFVLTCCKYLITVLGLTSSSAIEKVDREILAAFLIGFDLFVIVAGNFCVILIIFVLRKSIRDIDAKEKNKHDLKKITENKIAGHKAITNTRVVPTASKNLSLARLSNVAKRAVVMEQAISVQKKHDVTRLKSITVIQQKKEKAHSRMKNRLQARKVSKRNIANLQKEVQEIHEIAKKRLPNLKQVQVVIDRMNEKVGTHCLNKKEFFDLINCLLDYEGVPNKKDVVLNMVWKEVLMNKDIKDELDAATLWAWLEKETL